jgi:transcriptional regulator with XRE-family HTH domain
MLVERLASRIKALRARRRLSQEALAAKAGISRGYLARLETGRQDPTVGTVEKLAKALRVKMTALLK